MLFGIFLHPPAVSPATNARNVDPSGRYPARSLLGMKHGFPYLLPRPPDCCVIRN